MNSRSLIPVGLLALLLSSTAGCKKDEPPKPDPAVAAASASAKGKMNVRGPLGPMAKIDPQAMKDYRLDICYYGTFTLRQARDSYFASLGKDEPSEKKIPNFGIAAPPTTTPTTAPSGSAKAGAPSPNPSANVAPPASGSPRIGAAKTPTPTGLPLKNPPGSASGTIPGADRRPLDFAMRAPHERNARACTAGAALKEPAMGDVDLAVGAYAPFAVDLAKDISAANNYYTRGEYKDDAFAKGKAFHKKLVDGFQKLDELQDKVGSALAAWRKDHAADPAKMEEGEKEVRPVFDNATTVFLSMVAKAPDAGAYKANVEKLEKSIEALKAFSVAHAADPWSKIMIGPYEAFLRQAKDLKISDKGVVDADGYLGMVNGFTGLVEARQRALSRAMINKGQTVIPTNGAAIAPPGAPPGAAQSAAPVAQ